VIETLPVPDLDLNSQSVAVDQDVKPGVRRMTTTTEGKLMGDASFKTSDSAVSSGLASCLIFTGPLLGRPDRVRCNQEPHWRQAAAY